MRTQNARRGGRGQCFPCYITVYHSNVVSNKKTRMYNTFLRVRLQLGSYLFP